MGRATLGEFTALPARRRPRGNRRPTTHGRAPPLGPPLLRGALERGEGRGERGEGPLPPAATGPLPPAAIGRAVPCRLLRTWTWTWTWRMDMGLLNSSCVARSLHYGTATQARHRGGLATRYESQEPTRTRPPGATAPSESSVLAGPSLPVGSSSGCVRRLEAALRAREKPTTTSDPPARPWPSIQPHAAQVATPAAGFDPHACLLYHTRDTEDVTRTDTHSISYDDPMPRRLDLPLTPTLTPTLTTQAQFTTTTNTSCAARATPSTRGTRCRRRWRAAPPACRWCYPPLPRHTTCVRAPLAGSSSARLQCSHPSRVLLPPLQAPLWHVTHSIVAAEAAASGRGGAVPLTAQQLRGCELPYGGGGAGAARLGSLGLGGGGGGW